MSAVCLSVVVVASACGSASEPDAGDAACPPEQEPTGVGSAQKVDPGSDNGYLEVVDAGFLPAERANGNHVISYGFVVENTSDMVLYDASVSVSFVDGDGKNAFKVFEEDFPDADEYGWGQLKNISIPVVMPGEQAGLGDWVTVWTDLFADESGEIVHPDRPDYEELSVDVSLRSGKLWPVKNDVHQFVQPEALDIELNSGELSSSNKDIKYSDGTEMREYMPSHKVDFSGCKETEFYSDTSVLYDSEGNIVGGGRDRVGYTGGTFSPGASEDTHVSPSWGPEGDLTAEVFQYAKPLPVNVE